MAEEREDTTHGSSPAPLLETLLARLQGRETLALEAKSARHGVPQSLWSTVSAFANTQGGWIVLGVEEQNDSLVVTGVMQAHSLLQNLHTAMRNPQKISYEICGPNDISVEEIADKQVVVLRVPAAARKVRPLYCDGNPYKGTYVRRNEGDFRCTKAEVDRMMREASDVGADSAILPHLDWDDLDRDAVARYRRRYQTLHPESPWNGYNDQRFLQAVGGYRRDKGHAVEGITVAGLLLLGAGEAIREWRTRHLIDFRLTSGDADQDTRWDDRVAWEGNLFAAFEVIYPRLIAQLPIPFLLKGGTRVDEGQIHVILREALVNLLVHADYAETQASLIVRSTGAYLFRNPGSSRISQADLLSGDRSDPRNPELVRMFRFIGLAEEAGTGIPKIINGWRALGYRLPAIDVGTERYEFMLHLRPVHLISDDDRAWLHSLGDHWTEQEQLALLVARHEGDVDNVSLRRLTHQHPSDVTKLLGSLRDRGLLHKSGSGRSARYELGQLGTSKNGALTHQASAATPHAKPASIEDRETSIEGTETTIEDRETSIEGTERSDQIWHELENIARPAHERRRLDPTIRDAILVELCAWTPLSLYELAQLMKRSKAYVHEALEPLLLSRSIGFLYPNQPRHPRQKYVSLHDPKGPVARGGLP